MFCSFNRAQARWDASFLSLKEMAFSVIRTRRRSASFNSAGGDPDRAEKLRSEEVPDAWLASTLLGGFPFIRTFSIGWLPQSAPLFNTLFDFRFRSLVGGLVVTSGCAQIILSHKMTGIIVRVGITHAMA